jgi:hypothetical protein
MTDEAVYRRFRAAASLGGLDTLPIADSRIELRAVLAYAGFTGPVSDDHMDDVFEHEAEEDAMRVSEATFLAMFRVLERHFEMQGNETPNEWKVRFLEAAYPRRFLSTRFAAKLIVKFGAEMAAREDAGVERGAIAHLDSKAVQEVVRSYGKSWGDDTIVLDEFVKVAKDVLLGEAEDI